jgi:hypothetical protein
MDGRQAGEKGSRRAEADRERRDLIAIEIQNKMASPVSELAILFTG